MDVHYTNTHGKVCEPPCPKRPILKVKRIYCKAITPNNEIYPCLVINWEPDTTMVTCKAAKKEEKEKYPSPLCRKEPFYVKYQINMSEKEYKYWSINQSDKM